jgi:hypothetical protein
LGGLGKIYYFFLFKNDGLLSIFVVAISLIVFIKLKNWWDLFFGLSGKKLLFFVMLLFLFFFIQK